MNPPGYWHGLIVIKEQDSTKRVHFITPLENVLSLPRSCDSGWNYKSSQDKISGLKSYGTEHDLNTLQT